MRRSEDRRMRLVKWRGEAVVWGEAKRAEAAVNQACVECGIDGHLRQSQRGEAGEPRDRLCALGEGAALKELELRQLAVLVRDGAQPLGRHRRTRAAQHELAQIAQRRQRRHLPPANRISARQAQSLTHSWRRAYTSTAYREVSERP